LATVLGETSIIPFNYAPMAVLYHSKWYNFLMIITSDKPFTPEQLTMLKEAFDIYIKKVIDIKKKSAVPELRFTQTVKKFYLSRDQNKKISGEGVSI
jgi:hypothetical protein